jgi:ParB-like chromosome segregation protein Spo0J
MGKNMYERMAADVQRPRPGLSVADMKDRPSMLVELVRITDIKIGERYRQDLGDVQVLADSIKEVGLLHPPVIDSGNMLIAGERRIRACELLGWTEIPVRRLDLADIARGEYAENAIRKDFTPSEAVAIAKALEPYEKEAAAERMRGVRKISLGSEKGQTRDRLAAIVGMSGRTLEKAREVVGSGSRELIEEMDRTGKVDPVHRTLKGKAPTRRARVCSITVELTLAQAAEVVKALSQKPTEERQAIIKKVRSALLRQR